MPTKLTRSDAEFWIHQILSEKTQQMMVLAEEISVLNHQAQQFQKMRPEVQDKVMELLNAEFLDLDWPYQFEE